MDIDYLYKLLELSKITLIGYNYTNEHINDEIISKLSCIKIDTLYELSTEILRDIKINSLLNNTKIPEYIIVDFDCIFLKENIDTKYHDFENYNKYFKYLIGNISNKIGNIKIIIISSIQPSLESINFSCGKSILYLSDVAIIINEESQLFLIKNRYYNLH